MKYYRGITYIILKHIMQFSSGSTNLRPSSQASFLPQNVSISTINSLSIPMSQSNIEVFNYYYSQMMKVSQQLNSQLLINTQLIFLRAQIALPTAISLVNSQGGKSCNENQSTASAKNTSDCNQRESTKKVKRSAPKRLYTTQSDDEEDYVPSEDSQRDENLRSKSSQSKNIPKNYSKAIFAFIRRNQLFRNKVLKHLSIDQEQFMTELDSYKGGVSSIFELQQVWSGKGRISKAFRILSLEYLRKHCLWHIFNSRVNIYGRHIKYRCRMIESVADPENFTSMKEF